MHPAQAHDLIITRNLCRSHLQQMLRLFVICRLNLSLSSCPAVLFWIVFLKLAVTVMKASFYFYFWNPLSEWYLVCCDDEFTSDTCPSLQDKDCPLHLKPHADPLRRWVKSFLQPRYSLFHSAYFYSFVVNFPEGLRDLMKAKVFEARFCLHEVNVLEYIFF